MKQTARPRKTRKEKERAEIRKLEREIAELEKLELELKEEEKKKFNKSDRLLGVEAAFKATAWVALGLAITTTIMSGIGLIVNVGTRDQKETDAIHEYMDSDEYKEIKSGLIKQYYQEYENENLTTDEFTDKIDELESFDFVEANFKQNIQDKLVEIDDEFKEATSTTAMIAKSAMGAYLASYAMGMSGIGFQKKRKKADREYDNINAKIFKTGVDKKRKEEELLERE